MYRLARFRGRYSTSVGYMHHRMEVKQWKQRVQRVDHRNMRGALDIIRKISIDDRLLPTEKGELTQQWHQYMQPIFHPQFMNLNEVVDTLVESNQMDILVDILARVVEDGELTKDQINFLHVEKVILSSYYQQLWEGVRIGYEMLVELGYQANPKVWKVLLQANLYQGQYRDIYHQAKRRILQSTGEYYRLYPSIMKNAISYQDDDTSWKVLSHWIQHHCSTSFIGVKLLLEGYGKRGLWEEMYHQFTAMDIPLVCYNKVNNDLLCLGYLEGGKGEWAEAHFERMVKEGPERLSRKAVGGMVGWYIGKGKEERAWEVVKSVFTEVPIVVVNPILLSYCRVGKYEAIEEIVREKRVQPDHQSMMALLQSYLYHGYVDKAEELIDCKMEKEYRVKPRMSHRTALSHYLAKQ